MIYHSIYRKRRSLKMRSNPEFGFQTEEFKRTRIAFFVDKKSLLKINSGAKGEQTQREQCVEQKQRNRSIHHVDWKNQITKIKINPKTKFRQIVA